VGNWAQRENRECQTGCLLFCPVDNGVVQNSIFAMLRKVALLKCRRLPAKPFYLSIALGLRLLLALFSVALLFFRCTPSELGACLALYVSRALEALPAKRMPIGTLVVDHLLAESVGSIVTVTTKLAMMLSARHQLAAWLWANTIRNDT
jgi:hypothetical protein